jgi:hypothetical protein
VDLRERTLVSGSRRVWDWDRQAFRRAFGRQAMPFSHELAGLPGFDRETVTAVAGRVPSGWSRPHSGRLSVLNHRKVELSTMSAGDTARGLADNGSRLSIYYMERIEPYRTIIRDTLDELRDAVDDREGGVFATSLGFFMASPGAVVPSHFDLHHNFLLQLEGTKEITVATHDDPVEDQRVIEAARRWPHNNLAELPARTRTYALGPGDGLYIPPYAFHWVHGGSDDVSVALSYGFATPGSLRAPDVYWCNANLRRLGLRPRPPGTSERRDRAKAYAIGKAARARDAVVEVSRRGRRGPAGPASAR